MTRPRVVLLLLSLAAFLIYSNTFFSPFLFDDLANIVGNPLIKDLANFLDPSGTRYVGFLSFALNYAVGGLNVFGYHLANVLIHITNGFLVYWLVLLLFRCTGTASSAPTRSPAFAEASAGRPITDHRVTGHWSLVTGHAPPWIALLTALLFIAHPVQTQAVTYIVQRFASLVTLFYLLAVVCYLKWRIGETRGWKLEAGSRKLEAGKSSIQHPASSFGGICGSWLWYVAALIATVLAMKTKENSVTLPLTILLVEVIFFRAIRGAHVAPSSGKATWSLPLNGPSGLVRWLTLFPFLLAFLLFLVSTAPQSFQESATENLTRQDIPDLKPVEYLFTQFRVIVTYLRLLVWPVNQSLDYDYPHYRSLLAPPVFVSFLFLLGLLGFAVYLLRRASNSPQPPLKLRGGEGELCRSVYFKLVPFGILWFFLTLSVESSIIPIKDVIFEHRVYLPSVGFFLAVALLTALAHERWKRLRVPLILLVFAAIGGFSVAAHRRNEVWRDPITFWEDVVRKAPNEARGHNNLGQTYKDRGRLEEAIREYETALRLHPVYPAAVYGNIGVVRKMQGRLDEAIRSFQTGLKLNADDAELHNNLGNAYLVSGRLNEAIAEYRTALQSNPVHPAGVHGNLGFAYQSGGRLEEAIAEYRTALQLNPDDADIRNNLGSAYRDLKRPEEAIAEYRKGLRINPDNAELHDNLGNAYRDQGRLNEAIAEYQTALRLDPNSARAHNNLGAAYQAVGRVEEAISEYGASLRLDPNLVEAYCNRGSAYRAKGLLKEARVEYEEALKIRPGFLPARQALDSLSQGSK